MLNEKQIAARRKGAEASQKVRTAKKEKRIEKFREIQHLPMQEIMDRLGVSDETIYRYRRILAKESEPR